MTCLVISNTSDIHSDLLVRAADRLGITSFRLNTDEFRHDGRLALDADGGRISLGPRELTLQDVSVVIHRRPRHERHSLLAGSLEEKVLDSEWRVFELGLSDWTDAVQVNALPSAYRARSKLTQIATARRCALPMPATLLSNDRALLLDFLDRFPVVTKPVGPGNYLHDGMEVSVFTQALDRTDVAESKLSYPALLQRRIDPRAMWRVIYVSGDIFSVRMTGDALDGVVDSRFVEHGLDSSLDRLPRDVEDGYRAMCAILDIRYASSDFIEDQGGDLLFLDLNPDGQWAPYERAHDLPVSVLLVGLGARS